MKGQIKDKFIREVLDTDTLDTTDDTKFSETTKDYIDKILSFGFVKIYQESFYSKSSNQNEAFYMFWRNGVLLVFDTFYDIINGGNFYYNIKPKKFYKSRKEVFYSIGSIMDVKSANCFRLSKNRITSSGCWENYSTSPVWAGDHDCGEAVKFNILQLEKYGEILENWEFQPSLWLLNHMDTKGDYDYKKINKQKLLYLPKKIQKFINCKYKE